MLRNERLKAVKLCGFGGVVLAFLETSVFPNNCSAKFK